MYAPTPFKAQRDDFERMANAGASIVQGSQAHYPQSMEFVTGALIHYGLGNLFFDQMGDGGEVPTRHEFIDRHVIYDGRYISTELLTAELEDYARPRPMTPQERSAFLADYFAASGW
jgi:poly-gamma-glutamate synthesis protein (capsule biosynthesis protein)